MASEPASRNWWRHALCASRGDVDFLSLDPADVRISQQICTQCAVRDACLDDALRDPRPFGIRAGHTPGALSRLRRAAALAARSIDDA